MIINLIAYCGKYRKLQGGNQNHAYGHMDTMETRFTESKIWGKNIILIELTSSLPSQRDFSALYKDGCYFRFCLINSS